MNLFSKLDKRRLGTFCGTLVLALGCGYVMQNVLSVQAAVTPSSVPNIAHVMVPQAPRAALTTSLKPAPILKDRVAETKDRVANQGCVPQLVVTPAPAATLTVDVSAPCHALARANITQGKLTVSLATDEDGAISLRVPAFTTSPNIVVHIAGNRLAASADVPEAAMFEHVALHWSGPQVLRINAYEFGAQKSQFGHVWAGAPKSPARASRGSGGFLTQLGDDQGKSVEIYSFPSGQATSRGVIRLMAEAEVTQGTCGKRIRATAFQSGPLEELRPTEVAITMPDCDQLGETVRLQNLFQDMRLARR